MKNAIILTIALILNGCATPTAAQMEQYRAWAKAYKDVSDSHEAEVEQDYSRRPSAQMRYIQSRRPTQIKCSGQSGINGTYQSTCNSVSSGIDTSMYGN